MKQQIEMLLLQIKHLKEEKKIISKKIQARKKLLKYLTDEIDESLSNTLDK